MQLSMVLSTHGCIKDHGKTTEICWTLHTPSERESIKSISGGKLHIGNEIGEDLLAPSWIAYIRGRQTFSTRDHPTFASRPSPAPQPYNKS